jgi:hypothetical protein
MPDGHFAGQLQFICSVASLNQMEAAMRTVILSVIAVLAMTGAATARGCNGQGTSDDWTISSQAKSQVELSYVLVEAKAVTLLRAHVYFQIALDEVLADVVVELTDPAAVSASGIKAIALTKDAVRRLAKADLAEVEVFACTNYIEYVDGSGTIID